MKILVATNSYECSKIVTQMVIAQARPAQDEIRVVHVVNVLTNQVPEMRGYFPGDEHSRDAQKDAAEALLDDTARILRAERLLVSTVLKWGATEPKIIEAAQEWPADLIVLGSKGRTSLGHLLVGSVSASVIRRARCSVEIARPHARV